MNRKDPIYWISWGIIAFFVLVGLGFVTSWVLLDKGLFGLPPAPVEGALAIAVGITWWLDLHRPIFKRSS